MYLLFQKRQALENNNQLEPRVSSSKIHLIAMKKVEIFQEIKVHEGIKSGTSAHQADHTLFVRRLLFYKSEHRTFVLKVFT